METLEPILAGHSFLKGLEPHYIQLVVGCASNVRFNPDQFIFREGEEADQFYVIRHGKVAVEVFTPERGPLIIDTLGEGDILGWSWLLPPTSGISMLAQSNSRELLLSTENACAQSANRTTT